MVDDDTTGAEVTSPWERLDVVVIGAGQAGLAIGHYLRDAGCSFRILEAAESVGAGWRQRWDSLVLFTSRQFDALPGMSFPGDPDGYPTRDETVAYLESYATSFELPIEFASPVTSLVRSEEGFVLSVPGRSISAEQVVVATGPFQTPLIPAISLELSQGVQQMHSADYRRPDDIADGGVLVVGGGNTGFQIAKELSATRPVVLAVGSRQLPLPQRVLGRDLFWWLTKLGLLEKSIDSRLGRRAQRRETLIGSTSRELRNRYGVNLKPRATGAKGRAVTFADGTELEVDAVIWATGYRPDHSWIDLPIFSPDGRVRHRRGVTDVPGLYFLGLPWQYTRGSALLGFVKDDARYIAGQIETAGFTAAKRHLRVHDTTTDLPTQSTGVS
jgi:putative flavoprotein involved in K+ transport